MRSWCELKDELDLKTTSRTLTELNTGGLQTWLHDDGDLGRVLLSCRVADGQLEGVVSLLHGGQLQDRSSDTLNNNRTP